jgi:spore germination protein KB
MMISVLGPEIYSKDIFSLLVATQMVSVADFLERFDALVILMMVAGVFFKVERLYSERLLEFLNY